MNQRVEGPCWSTAVRALIVFGGLATAFTYLLGSSGSVLGLH